MDIATLFSGAMTGFSAIKDLSKLALDAKVDASVRAAVVDAVEKLGQAQQTMYDLRDELNKLQDENKRLRQAAEDRVLQDNRTPNGTYRCTATGCGAQFPIEPKQKMSAINYPPGGGDPGSWMGR